MNPIREFIYLDTEKIKSIFSQIEEGLLIETTKGSGNEKNVGGKIGSGNLIDLVLSGEAKAELLFLNRKDETKVLHDHMYNHVESKLLDNNEIVKVNDKNKKNNKLPKNIKNNSFVLLKGRVKIEDYNHMLDTIENMNDLLVSLAVISSGNVNYDSEKENINKTILNSLGADLNLLNENYIESLSSFFKHFYNDRLLLKCMPFEKNILLNFVGPLKKEYLRDSIENIWFKYGSFPTMEWKVFGRISSIPHKNHDVMKTIKDSKYKMIKKHWNEISAIINEAETFQDLSDYSRGAWKKFKLDKDDFEILKEKTLELSFEEIFESMDLLMNESYVKYPSVKFAPIAVYLE